MTSPRDDLEAWFRAQDAYHKAEAAYRLRLAIVRNERMRGNWGADALAEHARLLDAHQAALAASDALYRSLAERPAAAEAVPEETTPALQPAEDGVEAERPEPMHEPEQLQNG